MKKFAKKTGLALFLSSLILSQSASAIGTIFSRPLWGNQTYNKMWIKTVDVSTVAEGQIATTQVHQVFKNHSVNQQNSPVTELRLISPA